MRHADPGWRWLSSIETVAVDGDFEARTGDDVETLAIVLSGTFDILAGGGSWMARGVRQSPLDGKPVAIFLPPKTRYAFQSGRGELLLAAGVQPAQRLEKGEAAVKRPLLPLAGSGKAFDPSTGEWKREEDFPSAPEAILPRRIEVTESGGVEVRDVFPFGYKALCLTLCEVALRAGTAVRVPDGGGAPGHPAERAVFFDAPQGVVIAGEEHTGRGVVSCGPGLEVAAAGGDAYLAVVGAGPKL